MDRIAPSPSNQAALLGLDVNAIMWCDASRNPGVFGCQRISPACGTADNTSRCYAEVVAAKLVHMAAKMGQTSPYAEVVDADGWTGEVRLDETRIGPAFASLPKKAGARIRRIFVTSMGDLFHKAVTFAFLDLVFAEMAARPWLVFQVLTKRADRMRAYADDRARRGLAWPANVWAGVTAEDQRRADERCRDLVLVPAAVRFLSVEPMLGPIEPRGRAGGIHWVIIGSESNGSRPGARVTDPAWVLDLVDRCDGARVPVFVKQIAIGDRLIALPLIDGRPRADFPA